MDKDRLVKALKDAIPLGPHPDPHTEWVSVRLDFVESAIEVLDWIYKGLLEWRDQAEAHARQAKAARAQARVAIAHLQSVLNTARTHPEQQAADTAARDWLESIGSDR